MFDNATGRLVVHHAGRPALTPLRDEKCSTCHFTVMDNALPLLLKNKSAKEVEAVIVASICGDCFKHDQPEARHLVEPFYRLGDHVFANKALGALSLPAVIRHHLEHAGVPTGNITEVKQCTKENKKLSSHRNGDTTRNTVIVTLL